MSRRRSQVVGAGAAPRSVSRLHEGARELRVRGAAGTQGGGRTAAATWFPGLVGALQTTHLGRMGFTSEAQQVLNKVLLIES